ncbi:unnamed protein product [Ambrosiozyma monospora]|uniref:Unnamed protein product n=1 Tax=Ambrosiozyma monospora TaxID=43982 RepID=A0A9W6Z6W6_AMBMO|nr:unnamed protein product [Ambrosiozyma monospora]
MSNHNHPFSSLSGGGTGNNGYSQFDPESGVSMGRKKSLIRRDRSKRSSNSTTQTGASSANPPSKYLSNPSLRSSMDFASFNMAHSENSIPMEDLNVNPNAASNINDENASALNPFSSTPQTQRIASPQFLNTPTDAGAAYLEVPTDAPSTSANAQQQQQPTQQQQPLLHPSAANKTSPVREQFGLNDEDPNDNDNLPLGAGYTSLPPKRTDLEEERKGFPYWKVFCYAVTFWAPPPFLKLIGLDSKERRYAWREKMGLIAIILVIVRYFIK